MVSEDTSLLLIQVIFVVFLPYGDLHVKQLFDSNYLPTIAIKIPQSINELERIAKRDVKKHIPYPPYPIDVKYLEKIGLIEKAEGEHKTALLINYDRIAFEIAV